MTQAILHGQSTAFMKERPDIRPGYTVRVHERIQEGEKERVQVFEGLVVAVHRGHVPTDRSFTLRRTVSGVGVERVYALHSPRIERIEVRKIARVRRARLTFLRRISGKAARLHERFTTAEEKENKEAKRV
ncbi:50S ribosomal protein L19 [Candidatus Peregrinibacteria bacterium]|nr:50S ribosomal protein L19 [Candidatus Peregrinibacteria bacterium]